MKEKYDIRFLDIILIQLSLILCFSWIYYSMLDHFQSTTDSNNLGYIDCIFLSTSIQAGTGIYSMQSKTPIGKLIIIIQQMVLIISATYIIFTFTIN